MAISTITIALIVLVASTFVVNFIGTVVIGVRTETIDLLDRTTISTLLNGSCVTDRRVDQRRAAAFNLRVTTAYENYATPVPCNPNNGDEALYAPIYFASFTKGMLHDSLGHVVAYDSLLSAVSVRTPTAFDAIQQAPGAVRDFTNPMASLAFVLQGGDPQSFAITAAPLFASAEQAGELVENYWMAYTRDVSFADYATDPKTLAAVAELNSLSDFRGPTPVTPDNLFRGAAPGCDTGPYLSQFFYLPCVFGANTIDQRIDPPVAAVDYMTNFTTYLAQQNAQTPEATLSYSGVPRFMINGRDLSHWVHVDVLFQAYFQAMLCLLHMGAPLKAGIPYQVTSLNQMGFGTFGGPDIAAASTIGATSALKAAWFGKWLVNRRLRPEAFAARVHNHVTSAYTYPLHSDVLGASILGLLYAQHGSYLLPQAFPEGSPLHPSMPAGHASVAGACVTILKAFFDEEFVIPSPLMPNGAGSATVPLSPPASLTVGGELNKLAANVAIGRNIAGVHWRSDATESLRLGEQVAVRLLRDLQKTYPESFAGFTFTDFEGTLQIIA